MIWSGDADRARLDLFVADFTSAVDFFYTLIMSLDTGNMIDKREKEGKYGAWPCWC